MPALPPEAASGAGLPADTPAGQVLYACFDLDIAPPGFNVLNFLVLADIARAELGLTAIHVLFVPGRADGFRAEDIEYPAINKQWRLRQICIAALSLLPSCCGHTVCASRGQAERLLAGQAHVFPFGYGVDKPLADHDYSTIIRAAAAGHRVDRLQVPAQARIYARKWLERVAGGRRVVTITLRESSYDVHRSSRNDDWLAFARELAADGYCPVIVRDTECAFADDADCGDLPVFPHAAVNLELRAALYAEAWLNSGINQGPWTLWHFLPAVPYLCIYVIDRMYDDWHDYHINQTGFRVGADMPFARGVQVTFWGDDGLEHLRRAFHDVAARLDAGEHGHAETPPAAIEESRLALAQRYQQSGQHRHALALYELLLAERPDDPVLRYHAGSACLDGSDHVRAAALLEPLAEQLGGDAGYLEALARLLTATGRGADAQAMLESALRTAPQAAVLRVRLAEALTAQGEWPLAAQRYVEAATLLPDDVGLRLQAGEACLAAGDAEAAIGQYIAIAKRGVLQAPVIAGLGRALDAAGLPDQAAICFRLSSGAGGGGADALAPLTAVLEQHWGKAA